MKAQSLQTTTVRTKLYIQSAINTWLIFCHTKWGLVLLCNRRFFKLFRVFPLFQWGIFRKAWNWTQIYKSNLKIWFQWVLLIKEICFTLTKIVFLSFTIWYVEKWQRIISRTIRLLSKFFGCKSIVNWLESFRHLYT